MEATLYGQNVQTIVSLGILIVLWAIYREVRKIVAKGQSS